jgi:hypothetical protein
MPMTVIRAPINAIHGPRSIVAVPSASSRHKGSPTAWRCIKTAAAHVQDHRIGLGRRRATTQARHVIERLLPMTNGVELNQAGGIVALAQAVSATRSPLMRVRPAPIFASKRAESAPWSTRQ